jgi:hypothetical protein
VTEIAVGVKELKALVHELMDAEVNSRCYIAAVNRVLVRDPALRQQVVDEFDNAKPRERQTVELRFRGLLESLESGQDVSLEISKLLGIAGTRRKAS